VATEARGWRSIFRRSIAQLVPQPEQNTSSHGVLAISPWGIIEDDGAADRHQHRRESAVDIQIVRQDIWMV
jgi:hypothetical protein